LHFAEFALENDLALSAGDESYGWPFAKDFVLSKDPDIVTITAGPMRWR
jgi:hypothetical protein